MLQARDSSVEVRRFEFVGPQVGEELTEPVSYTHLTLPTNREV